jgi:pyridoxine 5-phosphate synthase
MKLAVNVDHVATVRQARRTSYPDPVEAALVAEAAGASGITVHLRVDRRHIQDDDVASLRRRIHGKLNLEMAATDEMVERALALKPDQVTLVPERAEEITTEGGLDVLQQGDRVATAATVLHGAGKAVSVFVDPSPVQLRGLEKIASSGIEGFEINTDAYTRTTGEAADRELSKVAETASLGAELGLRVYAGHGLTHLNVGRIARIPQIEELNIGHALVSRAILIGMEAAVREMLEAMAAGRR